MTTKTTAKERAGPARNPGTPRPGARRHGKRKTTSNNNMIQSLKSKIYKHPAVLCRNTFQRKAITSNFHKENAGVKHYSGTLTKQNIWATQDDPRPALHILISHWLIREKVSLKQWRLGISKHQSRTQQQHSVHEWCGHRDDARPAWLAPKVILYSKYSHTQINPEWSPGFLSLIPSVRQNIFFFFLRASFGQYGPVAAFEV